MTPVNRKKMLYFIHIDWRWIKQRPQFLCESMGDFYDITAIYPRAYRTSRLVNLSAPHNVLLKGITRFPSFFVSRSRIMRNIEKTWVNLQLRHAAAHGPYDYIWTTTPLFWQQLKSAAPKARLIYDCMDDNEGISDSSLRKYTLTEESGLLKNADLVFTSSASLAGKIQKRGYAQEPHVISNGISTRFLQHISLDAAPAPKANANDELHLLYYGTIAYWFDFRIMLRMLDSFPNLHLHIAGPADREIPSHARLHYEGVVPHHELPRLVANHHALIMPFIINDLIRSVDPVKLYEYISFGKPIITVWYDELKRFAPFINSYRDEDELRSILQNLSSDLSISYTAEDARRFLSGNTWDFRTRQIIGILNEP